uniref:hypothetical protein n=1 Tax=Ornithobacterium rhinotracheale TaxID=28251 RepID=UPI0039A77088
MENWQDLYKELAEKITDKMPQISWVDLWHNQVSFLADEHRFNTPAVFIGLRSSRIEDVGERVQLVHLQVDLYLFYETYLDTFHGAYNQTGALEFTLSLEQLHGLFHGTEGVNYSSMRRVDFAPIDTGGAGNLYKITFECILNDKSAEKYYEDTQIRADIESEDAYFLSVTPD